MEGNTTTTTDETDLTSIFTEGNRYRVHIPNTIPVGVPGAHDTQFEEFDADTVRPNYIETTDDTFGDTITVTIEDDGLHLQSGGKEGSVVRVEEYDTQGGVTVHETETIVYEEN